MNISDVFSPYSLKIYLFEHQINFTNMLYFFPEKRKILTNYSCNNTSITDPWNLS